MQYSHLTIDEAHLLVTLGNREYLEAKIAWLPSNLAKLRCLRGYQVWVNALIRNALIEEGDDYEKQQVTLAALCVEINDEIEKNPQDSARSSQIEVYAVQDAIHLICYERHSEDALRATLSWPENELSQFIQATNRMVSRYHAAVALAEHATQNQLPETVPVA